MRAITFASMDTPGPYETQSPRRPTSTSRCPKQDWDQNTRRWIHGAVQLSGDQLSIAAHEAYPGHYVQFLWMQQIHDRVRKLLGANTNVEGWAHYCEQMMLDEGLAQSHVSRTTRASRNCCAWASCRMRCCATRASSSASSCTPDKFTFDQAVDFFVKEGYQSRAVGTVETKRGTATRPISTTRWASCRSMKLRADVAGEARRSLQSADSSTTLHAAGFRADQDRAPCDAAGRFADALTRTGLRAAMPARSTTLPTHP